MQLIICYLICALAYFIIIYLAAQWEVRKRKKRSPKCTDLYTVHLDKILIKAIFFPVDVLLMIARFIRQL